MAVGLTTTSARAVRRAVLGAAVVLGAALCAEAPAQNATSAILAQYAAARGAWFDAIWPYANRLFWLLATIEFIWSCAVLALERADFQTFLAALVRRLMFIGAFLTLLTFGPTWIPTIINSFVDLGAAAGNGGAALTPSLVFQRGIEIAGRLLDGASAAWFISNVAAGFALVLSALLIALAFVFVTVQFVVAMVESYIVVGAGLIFLGFGGSRWTVPYVERYIALAVAVGVKILVLYLLIGLGMTVSEPWIASAIAVPDQPSPGMSALEIVGSALIFGMLCWQAPKLVSSLLGGAPSLSAGDALSSAAVPAGLAAGAAVLTAAAAGYLTRTISAAGVGARAASSSSTSSPTAATVAPPNAASATPSGGSSSSFASNSATGAAHAVPPPAPQAASDAQSGRATAANRGRAAAASTAQPKTAGVERGGDVSSAAPTASAIERAARAAERTQRWIERLAPSGGGSAPPPPLKLGDGD